MKDHKIENNAEMITEEELFTITGGYYSNDERLQNVIGTTEGRCSGCNHFRTLDVLFDSGVTYICKCPSCQIMTRIRYK